MEKRIPASVRLEHTIADLVEDGNWEPESLAELGRLGAQLMIQRAVEDEVREFLGRAHYERNPDGRGWRNGVRPRRVQKMEKCHEPEEASYLSGVKSRILSQPQR